MVMTAQSNSVIGNIDQNCKKHRTTIIHNRIDAARNIYKMIRKTESIYTV